MIQNGRHIDPALRTKVFISYSHKDKKWLDMLRPQLGSLARDRGIDFWDDTRIKPSSNWRKEISTALASTKVAILLISANFLDSSFIIEQELPSLLQAAEKEGASILQILVSPSRILHHPILSQFQFMNPVSRTLQRMPSVEREELFVKLTERIEEVLGKIPLGGSCIAHDATADPVAQPRSPTNHTLPSARPKVGASTERARDAVEYLPLPDCADCWWRDAAKSGEDALAAELRIHKKAASLLDNPLYYLTRRTSSVLERNVSERKHIMRIISQANKLISLSSKKEDGNLIINDDFSASTSREQWARILNICNGKPFSLFALYAAMFMQGGNLATLADANLRILWEKSKCLAEKK